MWGILRAEGRRAAGPRHADRPEQPVVRRAGRPAAGRVAVRGVRAGAVPCGHDTAGGRPVLRDQRKGDCMTFAGPDLVAGTVALVAQPTPDKDPGGGKGEDFGKSSPVGLLVVLLLLLAVVFLVRSMTQHPQSAPERFAEAGAPSGGG